MSVQLPPNSTGAVIDTNQATTGKERQFVAVGDSTVGANMLAISAQGAAAVDTPKQWSLTATPAAATQATVTQAAAGSGVQHVCDTISFSYAVDGTHAQTLIQLNLRDSTTGAGTVLWSMSILMAATEAMKAVSISGLKIAGTANHAMTLEFSAAGVTGSVQSVALTGHDIS